MENEKAALLECFSILNPKEAALMKNSAFLSRLADAVREAAGMAKVNG